MNINFATKKNQYSSESRASASYVTDAEVYERSDVYAVTRATAVECKILI